jgi:hypothetical protein
MPLHGIEPAYNQRTNKCADEEPFFRTRPHLSFPRSSSSTGRIDPENLTPLVSLLLLATAVCVWYGAQKDSQHPFL